MPKVQRKITPTYEVEVRSSDGKKRGHLTLTPGYVYYYRSWAKKHTVRYTYLQLIELMESVLEE